MPVQRSFFHIADPVIALLLLRFELERKELALYRAAHTQQIGVRRSMVPAACGPHQRRVVVEI